MGKLNNPRHLSYYELWTGRHGNYDPDFVFKFHDSLRLDAKPEGSLKDQDFVWETCSSEQCPVESYQPEE